MTATINLLTCSGRIRTMPFASRTTVRLWNSTSIVQVIDWIVFVETHISNLAPLQQMWKIICGGKQVELVPTERSTQPSTQGRREVTRPLESCLPEFAIDVRTQG